MALTTCTVPGGATIASYFRSFAPELDLADLCRWPPDVFALANLVLDHTEAYRFAVAPLSGRRWPPQPDWNEAVDAAARAWRAAATDPARELPDVVARAWDVVMRHRDAPLRDLREGCAPAVCEALLTLHATADEACRWLSTGAPPPPEGDDSFERSAASLLTRRGSFSRIEPDRIRITPKTHFSTRGITIRSFSRYLALNYEAVEVTWRHVEPARWRVHDRAEYNLVLLPWPLVVRSSDFRAVQGPLDNMDSTAFGFFEFAPRDPLDLDLLEALVVEAKRTLGRAHAVILPEGSVDVDEIPAIEARLLPLGVLFVVAGVRVPGHAGGMGHNVVHLGSRVPGGWEHFAQAKHHRWCLDDGQIRQYHLTRQLEASKVWWEAIDLPARTVQIIDIGGGATIAPLVCEDLARLDEVADVLRRVGPSLVVTLLLDGPQLPSRWPCRYATVLADEPGSAVLTLTSYGMAIRSRPAGFPRSRAVAMWSEPGRGLRPLELARGAAGLVVTVAVNSKTVWTADGRRHDANTPAVSLQRVEQLRVPATVRRRRDVSLVGA